MAFQSKILCFVTFRVQDPWATGGTNCYYYYNIIIIIIIIEITHQTRFIRGIAGEKQLQHANILSCCFVTFLCVSMWLNVNMNANVNKWKYNNILRPQIAHLGVVYIVLFACYISSQESDQNGTTGPWETVRLLQPWPYWFLGAKKKQNLPLRQLR